ncbi:MULTISPECIES: hypothetical protein [unclassified Bradyrhizobium]|uniref:hypothetical protein n=1 Tax=unclassified Bradyrhizobium TaxID=2631580 RepID=UPI00339581E8
MAYDRIPVYLVIKKTGLFDEEGRELTIIFDTKLSRSAADLKAAANPGTEVIKHYADK